MTIVGTATLEHAIGRDGLVSIRIRDGRIRVHGVDGDAVRVREAGGGDLPDLFTIVPGDGNLALELRRRRSTRLDIDLPRSAALVVETVSADIEVDGLSGDQRLRTTSGDLSLRGVSGQLAIDAVSGDVDISAIGETVLTVRSVSGDIDLRAETLASLIAATTSGDITIAGSLDGPGPFRIETVSGDGRIAPAGALRIETTTLSGDLHSEIGGRGGGPSGHRTLAIGDGGPLITFQSMSGDIRIVRPSNRVTGPSVADRHGSRPGSGPADEPTVAPTSESRPATNGAIIAAYDEARLRILRTLERGEIDSAEASRRFDALDDHAVNA